MSATSSIVPKECELEKLYRTATDPETGFNEAEAVQEAKRCLGNHLCQSCDLCRMICPELCITRNTHNGQIEIDLEYCKGCGICAFICPRKAIKMVREE